MIIWINILLLLLLVGPSCGRAKVISNKDNEFNFEEKNPDKLKFYIDSADQKDLLKKFAPAQISSEKFRKLYQSLPAESQKKVAGVRATTVIAHLTKNEEIFYFHCGKETLDHLIADGVIHQGNLPDEIEIAASDRFPKSFSAPVLVALMEINTNTPLNADDFKKKKIDKISNAHKLDFGPYLGSMLVELRKAFNNDAKLVSYLNSKYKTGTIMDYLESVTNKPENILWWLFYEKVIVINKELLLKNIDESLEEVSLKKFEMAIEMAPDELINEILAEGPTKDGFLHKLTTVTHGKFYGGGALDKALQKFIERVPEKNLVDSFVATNTDGESVLGLLIERVKNGDSFLPSLDKFAKVINSLKKPEVITKEYWKILDKVLKDELNRIGGGDRNHIYWLLRLQKANKVI